MIRGLSLVGLAAAAVILALGYLHTGLWPGAAAALLLGLLGGLAGWRKWDWLQAVVLAGSVLLAATGAFVGLPPLLVVAGGCAALAAWDLAAFAGRLGRAGRVAGREGLVGRHLLRLVAVVGLGFGLTAATLQVRVNLSFEITLLLAVLAILGLSQAVRLLRRTSD